MTKEKEQVMEFTRELEERGIHEVEWEKYYKRMSMWHCLGYPQRSREHAQRIRKEINKRKKNAKADAEPVLAFP